MCNQHVTPVAAWDICGTHKRKLQLEALSEECFATGVFPAEARVEYEQIRHLKRTRQMTFRDYDEALVGLFVRCCRGQTQARIREAVEHVFAKHRDLVHHFSKALIAHLKPTHHQVAITGGMQEQIERLGPYWGFDAWIGSQLEVDENGCYTGRDKYIPVLNKGIALRNHVTLTANTTLVGGIGIGDSSSDIVMLQAVEMEGGQPIAFNPKGRMRDHANHHGWTIVLEEADGIYVSHVSKCGRMMRIFGADKVDEAVVYTRALHLDK